MVHFVDITVNRDRFQEDIRRVIVELFPHWPNERIRTEELHGGYVNAMYKCWLESNEGSHDSTSQEPNLIMRVFNFKMDNENLTNCLKAALISDSDTDIDAEASIEKNTESNFKESAKTESVIVKLEQLFKDKNNNEQEVSSGENGKQGLQIDKLLFDRLYEFEVMKIISKHGLCAPIYGRFVNGLCYEYCEGTTLDSELMATQEFANEMSVRLAHFHSLSIAPAPHSPFPTLFEKMKKTMVPMLHMLMPEVQEGISKSTVVSYQKYPSMAYLLEQAEALEEKFEKKLGGMGPIVFCHNDLNPKNGIYNAKTKKFWFIDFELSMANFSCFDIGLHFASCCGHLLVDFQADRVPNAEFRLKWVRRYLTELNRLKNHHQTSDEFEKDVWLTFRRASLAMLLMFVRFGLICPFFEFKPIFQSEEFQRTLKEKPTSVAEIGLEAVKAFEANKKNILELIDQETPPTKL